MALTPEEKTASARLGAANSANARHANTEAKKARLLNIILERPGITMRVACGEIPVTLNTYEKWRQRDRPWAMRVDAAKAGNAGAEDWKAATYTQGFAAFRKQYFGMDSPWFHLEIIDAIENADPGSVTLILLPPEHGKTTLLTDFFCYKLATDPTYRITYGSARQAHGVKVGNRMRNRMDPAGPARAFVNRFGPFAPTPGRATSQPWATGYFNVQKKGRHDDQEYSFQAVGIGTEVQGTRCDRLAIDDVQGRKSLGQTEIIVETIRQDWLSRPGSFGATFIIGTRVGEGDVYEALMDEVDEETGKPLVTRVIKYAAVRTDFATKEKIYLWPERYSPDNYDTMRRLAGPVAWSRNYQQDPVSAELESFTEDVLDAAADELHSWEMPIPADVREIVITLDPALGGCCALQVQGWANERLVVLDGDRKWGLSSFEQIYTMAENLCALWASRRNVDGKQVPLTELIIEAKAMQKGLGNDQRIQDLSKKYGFSVVPHETGNNKNDDVLGVTAMTLSMRRGEITIPKAGDEVTQARIWPIFKDLKKWRPRKRGNRLKQDEVMALWFGWLRWRDRRHTLLPLGPPPAPPKPALPWKPMKPVFLTSSATKSPFARAGKGS